MIVIVGCNKGGASKSTTVQNIAVALTKLGHDVCVVDADRQRTTAKWQAYREICHIEPAITLYEKLDNIAPALRSLNEKYDFVIVDVAGRNSRELLTGASVADILIAPHMSSQADLDTLEELTAQVVRVRDLNPELKVFAYQSFASTNPKVKEVERAEFLEYLTAFPDIQVLESRSFDRKIYRDALAKGLSVIECDNGQARLEVDSLVREVFHGA
jgi:chromosome partitioning protein